MYQIRNNMNLCNIDLRLFRLILIVLFFHPLLILAQGNIDYKSLVAENGSTSEFPTHYPYGTHGPYIVYNKVWVFYSDGEYAIWKTKQIDEGGEWDEGSYVFDVTEARYFNMAFDGEYFHFIRALDGDLKYLRGKANPDGTINFDPEVTAYSDPVWKIRITEGVVLPRHFSIYVDSEKKVWVAVKVGDGNEKTSNFKPIALSSIADDGPWISRSGFPVDLAPAYGIRGNGRALNIIEISSGNILYSWANDRESTSHPDQGIRTRLWSDGIWGEIEITGLSYHPAASSLVVPEPGIVILNSQTEVAKRTSNGTWSGINPEGMINSFYNSLSAYDGKVRLWDYANGVIRYKETEDNGETWATIHEKWDASDILHFSASHSHGSNGDHHSILWSKGANPYDVVMGIEGEYALQAPPAPLLVNPTNGAPDVSNNPTLIWENIDLAITYNLEVSENSDMSNPVVSETGIIDTMTSVLLEYKTEYFWRVRGENNAGEGDWSAVWSFTAIEEKPETPVLATPVDGAQNIIVDTVFAWDEAERAESYLIQISVDPDFTAIEFSQQGITDTEIEVTGLSHETTYYWRIAAVNSGGQTDWSDIWSFTTIVATADAPLLVSPGDGAENIAVDTMLVWEETEGADSYNIQVSKANDFSDFVVEEDSLSGLSYDIDGLESLTTYYWRVRAANKAGYSNWSEVWSFTTYDITSVRELADNIPDKFNLEQNYPNPFNPATTIRFALPKAATVQLEIYNMLGQRVATLINGEHYTAGTYEAIWDARDDTGNEVSSGLYIYRISAGEYMNVKRMVFMK